MIRNFKNSTFDFSKMQNIFTFFSYTLKNFNNLHYYKFPKNLDFETFFRFLIFFGLKFFIFKIIKKIKIFFIDQIFLKINI